MKKALLIGLAFSFIDAALGAQSIPARRHCISARANLRIFGEGWRCVNAGRW